MTRLAVWLALLAAASPAVAQEKGPNFDSLTSEATLRLREYLRIKTINPPGNETLGARWLQGVLAREGIESQIFESSPGQANLYEKLPGTGHKRPLILLSHLDVVPATSATWKVDPWSGPSRPRRHHDSGPMSFTMSLPSV